MNDINDKKNDKKRNFLCFIEDLKNAGYFKGVGLGIIISLMLVFIGGVGLDQVTKYQAHKNFLLWEDPNDDEIYRGEKIYIFSLGDSTLEQGRTPFFFRLNLQYSRNKGAAFSTFANLPDKIRVPLFYAITVIAIIIIFTVFRSTAPTDVFTRLGLTLIFSGAVGNFIDRILRGYVIDFIDVDWNFFGWKHDFAIFNVADMLINMGLICWFIDVVIHYIKNKKIAKSKKSI